MAGEKHPNVAVKIPHFEPVISRGWDRSPVRWRSGGRLSQVCKQPETRATEHIREQAQDYSIRLCPPGVEMAR